MSLPPFLAAVASAGLAGTAMALVWALVRRHLRGGPGLILAGGLLVLARFLWVDPALDTWLPETVPDRDWTRAEVLSEPPASVAEAPVQVSIPATSGPETDWVWMVWSLGALTAASMLAGRGWWAAVVRRRGSSFVGIEAQNWDPEVRALVVAHEATHVRQGHLWLALVVDLAACVHWYSPGIWWLRQALAVDREPVCDQACLRGQDTTVRCLYARALVDLASSARGAPAWSVTGRELRRRIMMITDNSKRGALAASGTALFVLVLLITACVSTGFFRSAAPVSDLVGTWTTVDFVAHPDDFIPGVRSFQDPVLLEGLSWDGRGPWMMQVRGAWERSIWTVTPREVVGDGLKGPWFVAHQGGKVYLAFAWLSGDVARGEAPHYYILEKTAPPRAAAASYPVDRTPPGAFVDDPAVAGSWKSVAFVDAPDAFVPGTTTPGLYLSGLEFQPSGQLQVSVEKGTFAHRWSQGYLWWASDRVRSPYMVKRIGDRDYLFITWISGDVLDRGQAPSYYVLSR